MSEVYIKEPNTKGKAIFRTTHGDLEIELWATETPKACRNFCQLILEGYYNGTEFHRCIRDFIIQGGDKTNTGNGSESIYGEPFIDEIHPRLKFRYRGMMGVASAGKGTKTNGSQFFIVMNRTPTLDGKHTLFAKVVGQTVYNLVRMSELEVDKHDRPLDPPRVVRAELVWDPFDDLEPRHRPEVPKSLTVPEEQRKRVLVRDKKKLSFGESEGESEDEAGRSSLKTKAKSAHDLLEDPKLLRDAAYPEQARCSGGNGSRGANAGPSEVGSIAKRVAVVAATTRGGGGRASSASEPASEDDGVDFGGDSEDDCAKPDSAKRRSDKRNETIEKLKRDIANVGPGRREEETVKKASSAVEELRAGYKPREPRVVAKGKSARRQDEKDMVDKLKDFRSRIAQVSSERRAPEENLDEASKKRKKDKHEKHEKGPISRIIDGDSGDDDDDWLHGDGLKFHVSADKAFQIDRDKAKETLRIFDPLASQGNLDVLEEARRKASDKVAPRRVKVTDKDRKDDRDRKR